MFANFVPLLFSVCITFVRIIITCISFANLTVLLAKYVYTLFCFVCAHVIVIIVFFMLLVVHQVINVYLCIQFPVVCVVYLRCHILMYMVMKLQYLCFIAFRMCKW